MTGSIDAKIHYFHTLVLSGGDAEMVGQPVEAGRNWRS